MNSDTEGYHDTITQMSRPVSSFIRTLRPSLARTEGERLFSVEARLGWVEPDLAALHGL